MPTLHLSQDADADALLTSSPLALLLGMLLDQQIPMEKAFKGPHVLLSRLGSLDAASIASYEPEEFAALVATPPAVHRFPGSMAKRLQDLGAAIALEGDLTFSDLRGALAGLLGDAGRRERMADAARSNGRPDAAERLVDVLLEVAGARS